MIDERKINPNLEKLNEHFDKALDKYFDSGHPKQEYFEEATCYNCGSDEVKGHFTVKRFRHNRCRHCGMVYVSPRLKEEVVGKLYSSRLYDELYKLKLIPAVDYRRNVLAVRKYEQIMQYCKKKGKVLDIGCGLGEVLSVFKESGWECTGVETNNFASNYARRIFNLNIIEDDIYTAKIGGQYDVIMMWGVLEHFYRPIEILEKCRGLLVDDGILVVEVPNADSLLVRYCEKTNTDVDRIIEGDRHIMLFSLQGLKEMMTRAGFHSVNIVSNGLDVSTLNRIKLNGALNLDQVNKIQSLLDDSLQGDLLRGFFSIRNDTR